MVKLFGWESRVRESVAEKREEELKWIWKRKLLRMIASTAKYVEVSILRICRVLTNGSRSHTIPLIHMVVTYGVYVRIYFCYNCTYRT